MTGNGSTLFLPPEVAGPEGPTLCTYFGWFSTEAGNSGFSYNTPITIAGGNDYTIEWTLSGANKFSGNIWQTNPGVTQDIIQKIKSEMRFIFFSPGDYKATVTLRYHVADDPPDFFRTTTKSYVVHVAAQRERCYRVPNAKAGRTDSFCKASCKAQ